MPENATSRIVTVLFAVSILHYRVFAAGSHPAGAVAGTARAYPSGCLNESPSYYDYDNYPCPPEHLKRLRDEFSLLRRLGAGKFSDVFEAVDEKRATTTTTVMTDDDDDGLVDEKCLVVIKCLKPVSERKIRRELLVLSHATNLPNLVSLLGVCREEEEHTSNSNNASYMPTSLILKHAGPSSRWFCHGAGCDSAARRKTTTNQNNGQPQQQLEQKEEDDYYLTEYEMKYFLLQLLIALDALHSRGIMHRDVKPRNVLITRSRTTTTTTMSRSHNNNKEKKKDHQQRSLMLIDLGLADFYLPNQRYNVRVASRHYKAPELLIGHEYYDYSLDMWGVGCMLAGLLFRKEPFFRGRDNIDQLAKIASVLGTPELVRYCDKCKLVLTQELQAATIDVYGERQSWKSLFSSMCSSSSGGGGEAGIPTPSQEAFDLLDRLLVYDHDQRLTAKEAMMHPFFDQVRDQVG